MPTPIHFYCKHFSQLSTTELYEAIGLRLEVFAVEQDCPYQDADGKDYESWHVLGVDHEETMVAYARILPKGIAYKNYASIGRVVSKPSKRGTGLGKQLMEKTMRYIHELLPDQAIKISAQAYLIKFYEGFGFEIIGEEYLEDGIPHIGMVYK